MGATGVQADYLARMVRAGTFELRVMVDSLAVCWRAVQAGGLEGLFSRVQGLRGG